MKTQSFKAGYESGYHGHKPMTKAQYTGGFADMEAGWKEYRQGLKCGKEDKREGYPYAEEAK